MNKSMIRRAVIASGIAILATVSFGSPERYIADMIWTDDAAPWEKVTAVYMPDQSKPNDIFISDADLDDVEACRAYVRSMAADRGDPDLEKGQYDCAVGFYSQDDEGGGVSGEYRLKVK